MDKKKLAAITAAVFTYIKTQEDMGVATGVVSSNTQLQTSTFGANLNYPSVWGLAGRNAQMNMRSMMQMRTFK